jgi:hypothetical protein
MRRLTCRRIAGHDTGPIFERHRIQENPGRAAQARPPGQRVHHPPGPEGPGTPLHNYASYLGVADLAAAAVRADRRIEGRNVIERALSPLNGIASPRLGQLIARARGLLADSGEAGAHFETALADPAGDQWPFERAQLRLDHAECLRRRRRINDAKPVLAEALETFRRLRARSWAQRAELRAE